MNLQSASFFACVVLVGCGGAFTMEKNDDGGATGGGNLGGANDASLSGGSSGTGGMGGAGALGTGGRAGAAGESGDAGSGGGGGVSLTGGAGGVSLTGGAAGALTGGAAGVATGGHAGQAGQGGQAGQTDAGPRDGSVIADAGRADAVADDAPIDLSACSGPGQCVAVLRACCPTCTTPEAPSYTGVNEMYASTYRTRTCGRSVCPAIACPVGSTGGVNPNVAAQCVMGHCEVFDVRRVPEFSGCTVDKDCAMRAGLGCCECGTASAGWVGVSLAGKSALQAAMCTPTSRCLACIPMPPPGAQSLCQNKTCVVAQAP
jgi:hypothetical protein